MIAEPTFQRLELQSQLESLSQIEAFIDEFCDQRHVSEDDYGNILIALTEAVNNAITHGNQFDLSKKVFLDVEGNENEVEFIVEDEGKGFNLNDVPDPTQPNNINSIRGRGIFLMKHLTDDISFENNGSKIKLKFTISNT